MSLEKFLHASDQAASYLASQVGPDGVLLDQNVSGDLCSQYKLVTLLLISGHSVEGQRLMERIKRDFLQVLMIQIVNDYLLCEILNDETQDTIRRQTTINYILRELPFDFYWGAGMKKFVLHFFLVVISVLPFYFSLYSFLSFFISLSWLFYLNCHPAFFFFFAKCLILPFFLLKTPVLPIFFKFHPSPPLKSNGSSLRTNSFQQGIAFKLYFIHMKIKPMKINCHFVVICNVILKYNTCWLSTMPKNIVLKCFYIYIIKVMT